MAPQRPFKLNYASRLILAAMTLLLPLVVFMVILVDDRNVQIRAAEAEITGLETLVETRQVMELVLQHHALVDDNHDIDGGHGTGIPEIEHETSVAFDALIDRTEAAQDPYRIAAPLRRIRSAWLTAQVNLGSHSMDAFMEANTAIARDLAELFREVGNESRMAVDPSIESSHLVNLLVNELPQMVSYLGEARNRSMAILDHDGIPTSGELRQLNIDDWALTVAHDNLFYGFSVAVEEDPRIAESLGAPFEEFDRDTSSFHRLIASGNIDHNRDEIFALGSSSIEATLRLFDRIAPELRRVLETRAATLRKTKYVAIASVIAASVIAGLSGFALLRGLTRPLQTEIKERRRVQARLRDLAAIVEQAEDSILTLSPTGELTSWNAGAERLYGYTADEVVGRNINILSPEGFEHETTNLLRKMMAGEALRTRETIRVRKDGELVDVSLRFSLIRNPDGELRGAAVIARDIRERKRAEEEIRNKERMLQARIGQLRAAQDELQQHRDRLEEKVRERTAEVREKARQLEDALKQEKEFSALQRKFVSMASHEFRTPLAIIDGAAQRIERRIDSIETPELEKRLSRIRGAVGRMLELIESTLSASRFDAGQIEMNSRPVDIAAVVHAVCERQGELSDDLSIEVALDALPDHISGDPALLDQVFTNLLSNAVKYSPDRPRIRVSGMRDDDGTIAISVRDNGVGIPPGELPQIFDRFFRAATSEGIAGTGIGLDLAREFVEMHGGTITVESEVGVGTTFTVHLPEHSTDTETRPARRSVTEAAA